MAALFTPQDGRLTSQNVLSGPLDGGEVMWIVSPGNPEEGNTYQISTQVLAAFCASFAKLNTKIVTAGATLEDPLQVSTTDSCILFNKTLPSASYAILPPASMMIYPGGVLFKDIKGDAATNPITISFSGGQLCDGQFEVVITTDYGWVTINPVPGGNAWYMA